MNDLTVTTYTRARAEAELDRIRRGVAVCACGAEYRDTADGKRVHQLLHGHRVSAGGVR